MIVDAHNDLLLELVLRRDEENPFARWWLPKLRSGGVGLQVCALYAADVPPEQAARRARAQVAEWQRLLEENRDAVFAVRSREDLQPVGADGRIGLMLSLEGAEPLEHDFDEWWEAGVRMVSLTWNAPNAYAGGIDSPEQGLTADGRALVEELAARGVVLDVAHASPRTFDDVLERAPHVVCSHACCRALNDVPRNLSDEQLRALAAHDGVLGLMALGLVVGYERATIDGLVDHLAHAATVMGDEHVGFGADVIDQVTDAELEAGEGLVDVVSEAREHGGGRLGLHDFAGPDDYPALVAALERRGFTGERLAAVTHGNFLRVLRAALP